ncbi:hypothetical protein JXA40_03345 [bacterium]|nr:hypothetical protein [candidate division CSSED10-310 bacterium]
MRGIVCMLMMILLAASVFLIALGGCGNSAVEIYPPVEFKAVHGSFSGEPVADNLEITVVDAYSGKPLKGATVLVHQGHPPVLSGREITGPEGKVSFAGNGINSKVTVTVTGCEKEAYDTISFVNVNSADMTIPLTIRKSPNLQDSALTFLGLDNSDDELTYYVNDVPGAGLKISSEGRKTSVDPDPYVYKIADRPGAVSAMAVDATENTTKFGFSLFPRGPLPVSTPAVLDMSRISQETVKIVQGHVQNPPANLDPPSGGWNPQQYYSMAVFADGGIAGDVFAGFGNIMPDYKYQAFCCRTPGLDHLFVKVTAFNRSDLWAESAVAFLHSSFQNLPQTLDLTFKSASKGLHAESGESAPYPLLKWEPGAGDMDIITIRHDDYDFNWELYLSSADSAGSLTIPPLIPGSEGALIPGEEYRFRVDTWTIPQFDIDVLNFQKIRRSVTHKSRSGRQRFWVGESRTDQD